MRRILRIFPSVSFFFIVTGAALAVPQAEQLAKQAVESSGRTSGLAIHVGAGSPALPSLTADLAAQSGMLVHGLAVDPVALSRARAAIAQKKLAGQAMVESVPLTPLPYLDNLATLVVVDDPAAITKAGVRQDDLLRIVSPGGSLLILSQGKWSRTMKPFPKEADNWTHPGHDAGNTHASLDKLVKFPMSLAWQDGVPMNIVSWAAVRSIVLDSGRTFSIGTTEPENLGPINGSKPKSEEYLTARDVYNGLVLWKENLGTTNDGGGLSSTNAAPVVASEGRVYVYCKDRLVAFDGATGKRLLEFPVKHPAVRVLILDGVLISAGWESREPSKEEEFNKINGLWAPWTPKTPEGALEAFDTKSGKLLWSSTGAASTVLAADDRVYVIWREGNPAEKETVAGLDLKTGKELWRTEGETIGAKPMRHLGSAGYGVVTVIRVRENKASILDGKTGKQLWEIGGSIRSIMPLSAGVLWTGGRKYDPATGAPRGVYAGGLVDGNCTPSTLVGNVLLNGRTGRFTELTEPDARGMQTQLSSATVSANRASCIGGFTVGNGMLVTGQNNCACTPGQMPGGTGFSSDALPEDAAFTATRPVEKGPAFGKANLAGPRAGEWPMLRGDPERSAVTETAVPESLKLAWTAPTVMPRSGALAPTWNARLQDCITAPVAASGKVFVAGRESGQIVAFDAATGKELWRFVTGSRIDAPPTISGDLCVAGSHDGYIYALRAGDGQLAWRLRLAPVERRMVAFGAVESSWPVIGSPIVTEKAIYATAGRSAQADGGMVAASIDPMTGATHWISRIPATANRQNDILAMDDGQLKLHQLAIDPGTGTVSVTSGSNGRRSSLEGLIDGTWTRMNGRRSGKHKFDDVTADAIAWNGQTIFGYIASRRNYFAISRDKTIGEKGNIPPAAFQFRTSQPGGTICESFAVAGGDKLVTAVRKATQTGAATGELLILSASDGKQISSIALPAAPTFDAVAVTEGRLFVATEDGQISCLTKE